MWSDQKGYDISYVNGTLTVNKLALTGSIAAGSSTYGSVLAPGTATMTNVVGSDVLTTTTAVDTTGNLSTSGKLKAGTYNNKEYISALGGADAGNYTYANVLGNYTVNKLALTGTAIALSSSTYGSSLNPGAVTFGIIVAGDTVTDTASVNTSILSTSGKPIAGTYTQTAGAIGGADAGNYRFAGFTSGLNYTINKANLLVHGLTAINKTYDATTAVTLGGTAAVTPLTGDVVTIGGTASGTFADKNAGTGKAVTVIGNIISGTDAGNYNLIQQTGLTADIYKVPLTITVMALKNKKRYDGTTAAAAIPKIISGILYGTDTANFIETYNNANIGRHKTLTVSGIVNDGNGGDNYVYTFIDNYRGKIKMNWPDLLLRILIYLTD